VLGPDTIIEEEKRLTALVLLQEIQPTDKNVHVDLEVSKSLENHAKRKRTVKDGEKERKRRRKQHVTQHRGELEKHTDKTEDTEANNSCILGKSSPPPISQKDQKVEDVRVSEKNRSSGVAIDDYESKADRKRRKEEKKRLKKLEKDAKKTHSNSGNRTKPEEISSATASGLLPVHEPKKRKKKRKHADVE
jgi:hypothetical protein